MLVCLGYNLVNPLCDPETEKLIGNGQKADAIVANKDSQVSECFDIYQPFVGRFLDTF